MYYGSVLLPTLILPLGSICVDQGILHNALPIMLLVGKWFAFWAGGMRLFIAGIRQSVQPRFAAETIFAIKSDDRLPFIRELGMANIAMGVIGMLRGPLRTSSCRPRSQAGSITRKPVSAICATAAATCSVTSRWSDLFVGAALLGYVGWAVMS